MESAREEYLVTQVMTATPQKLQLMLIDAAIRSARQAQENWQHERDEEAGECLLKSQQIVTQLIAGLDSSKQPELVRQVAGIYMFIFRALVFAHLRHDEDQLNDALQILESERETWKQVCEQNPDAPARPQAEEAAVTDSAASPDATTSLDLSSSANPPAKPTPPSLYGGGFDSAGGSESFTSFEA